jgi:hypothetical protein
VKILTFTRYPPSPVATVFALYKCGAIYFENSKQDFGHKKTPNLSLTLYKGTAQVKNGSFYNIISKLISASPYKQLVEMRGIEPLTSALRTLRSPN